MREKLFASSVMLILSAILIFPQNELRACSCVPPPPPAEEFQDSDAVFIGTVTSFKVVDSDPHSAANRKANLLDEDSSTRKKICPVFLHNQLFQ